MGTFIYGDLSSSPTSTGTTYQDGEAFASGLDVHMAVAGASGAPTSTRSTSCRRTPMCAHRRQAAGLRILKRAGERSDPTCSPGRSLGVPPGAMLSAGGDPKSCRLGVSPFAGTATTGPSNSTTQDRGSV